jgi:hypothetical protein
MICDVFPVKFTHIYVIDPCKNNLILPIGGGTRCRSWLRHYATSRKIAGSIRDEIVGFFN